LFLLLLLPAAAAAAPAVGLLHLVQQQCTYSMLPLQLMPAGTPTRAAMRIADKAQQDSSKAELCPQHGMCNCC
jgi:hypothetical protein